MNPSSRLSNAVWILAAMLLAGVLVGLAINVQRLNQGQEGMFPQSHLVILRADGTKAEFDVEVATTQEQQEHGLMFRKILAPDAGMIFIWPADQPVSMWMKNTLIPLDMLYVASDGKITKIVTNAVPNDLTPLPSEIPIRAVIEIGGGEASKQNIKTGDSVVFEGL